AGRHFWPERIVVSLARATIARAPALGGALESIEQHSSSPAYSRNHARHSPLRRSKERGVGRSARRNLVEFFCTLETATRRVAVGAKPLAGNLFAGGRADLSAGRSAGHDPSRLDRSSVSRVRIRTGRTAAFCFRLHPG